MGSTKPIRVWKELAAMLEILSEEYGYVMSDLASAILYEAFKNPHLIAYTLKEWFDIDWEEAIQTALEISFSLLEADKEEREEAENKVNGKVKAIA